jgi:uncharacterized membrane protein YgcG
VAHANDEPIDSHDAPQRPWLVATRCSLLSVSVLAPLILTGCWIFAPQETNQPESSAEPERELTLGERYAEQWAKQEQAYAATAEGAYERMQALYVLNGIYVEFRHEHRGHEAEVPLAEWEASLTSKLDAEIAWSEATVAAWDQPMPEDIAQRPTNNLRILHGIYVQFLVAKGEAVELVTPHFVTMMSVDRVHDPSDLVYPAPDRRSMEFYESRYGREATQSACRQAVDAMPKKAQHQRLMIMLGCEWYYYATWREDLSQWATKKEVKAFDAEFGDDMAAAVERDAEKDAWAAAAAEWEAQTPPQQADDDDDDSGSSSSGGSGGGGGSSSSSSAPTVVSVTIRNSCSKTVKVFYGDNPKFGSGRQSSLSGNSRQSSQMRPGDMIWLIDDSSNGLASATVSSSTREITVTSSCTGITSK